METRLNRREFCKKVTNTMAAASVVPYFAQQNQEQTNSSPFHVETPLIGPYLLPTTSLWNSVRIACHTRNEGLRIASGVIRYGVKKVGEKEVTIKPAYPSESHIIALNNLQPDTEYKYQLALGDFTTPVYRFRTSAAPGARSSYKAAIICDPHAHTPEEGNAAKTFFERAHYILTDLERLQPDVIILGGDIVDFGSVYEQYDYFFHVLRDACANSILLTCPGNHEWAFDPDLLVYKDFFPGLDNGPAEDAQISWSVAYGGVGYSMRRSHMARGLRETIDHLRKNDGADFIVDTQHHPVFIHSNKNKQLGHEQISPIFESERVNLSISGHRHMHQRTYPLNYSLKDNAATTQEKSDYSAETKGTIHIQFPSLWYQYAKALDHPLMAKNGIPSINEDYTGYGEMIVDPDHLTISTFVYSHDGKTRHEKIDEFRMARQKQT
jgi:hypothetical protein